MKERRFLAIMLVSMLIMVIPWTAFAIEPKTSIDIDGSKMVTANSLSKPTLPEDSAYYYDECLWYTADRDGNIKELSNGTRVQGEYYVFVLRIIFTDPNAYSNNAFIDITNVDWQSQNFYESVTDGARTMNFEGVYHAHKGTYVAEVQPTCSDSGVKAHWLCDDCKMSTLDEEGLRPAYTQDMLYIPALENGGHQDGDGNGNCDLCGAKLASDPVEPDEPEGEVQEAGEEDASKEGEPEDVTVTSEYEDDGISSAAGLSGGAIAAIVIAVIAVCGAVFGVIAKRRKRN